MKGHAIYSGDAGTARVGNYTGDIEIFEFGKLCLLAEQICATRDQAPELGFEVQRLDLTKIELTSADESTLTFYNSPAAGDYRLWLLEYAIEGVAGEIEWASSSDSKK